MTDLNSPYTTGAEAASVAWGTHCLRCGRPRLLDAFSGAGGCSVGYYRAGFCVTGVDKLPHGDYPFELIVDDALNVLADVEFLAKFAVVSTSPPCQGYSTITPDSTRDNHPRLIEPVRALLHAWGGLYVIENVEGARRELHHPLKLCGSAFGLRVQRHRYFETNVPHLILTPHCRHAEQGRPVGVYGDHPQDDADYRRPDGTRRGQKARTIGEAGEALGIDWMTDWDDLTDAIPPVFTEFIGGELLSALAVAA